MRGLAVGESILRNEFVQLLLKAARIAAVWDPRRIRPRIPHQLRSEGSARIVLRRRQSHHPLGRAYEPGAGRRDFRRIHSPSPTSPRPKENSAISYGLEPAHGSPVCGLVATGTAGGNGTDTFTLTVLVLQVVPEQPGVPSLENRATFGITSLFVSLASTVTLNDTVAEAAVSSERPVHETTPPRSDAVQPAAPWQSAEPST